MKVFLPAFLVTTAASPLWAADAAVVVGTDSGAAPLVVPGVKDPLGTATVTKIEGDVKIAVDGRELALNATEKVPMKAAIKTGAGARVAITLSNGTLLHLGEESEATLDVFVQEPFAMEGKVEELATEPSMSRVVLRLVRGELAAQLPRLRAARGSSLNLSTDAGLLWTQTGGATFLVKATALDVLITVTEGTMRFRPPSKDEMTIAGGDQLRAEVLGAALLK